VAKNDVMSHSLLKKLGFFCGILVLLGGLYFYRQVPQTKSPFHKAIPEASRMKIERAGKSVEFAKVGNDWKVKLGSGELAMADETQFPALLSSLKNVQVEDEISDRADRASDFEVDASSGSRVTFWDAKNKALADGIFGKQAADYLHIFYRPADQPNVFLARGVYRGELGVMDPLAWRSRQLINIPEPEIKGFTIEKKGAKTEYVRVSTESWTANGKAVPAEDAHRLIGTIAHLRADSHVTSLDLPAPTYENLTFARIAVVGEKSQAEIRIGPLDKKTPRYPLSSGPENGITWLSQATVDSLLSPPSNSKP
jgi:hypothetical protein